jgi:hypothetical protein
MLYRYFILGYKNLKSFANCQAIPLSITSEYFSTRFHRLVYLMSSLSEREGCVNT